MDFLWWVSVGDCGGSTLDFSLSPGLNFFPLKVEAKSRSLQCREATMRMRTIQLDVP